MRKLRDLFSGRRFLAFATVSAASLASAGIASAQTVAPPTAPDFTNAVNTYGTSLANGLMPILIAVLGVAAVFTLYKIGVKAIKKWLGRANATNATN